MRQAAPHFSLIQFRKSLAVLFNHPVGAIHNRLADVQAEGCGRFKIDDKFKNDRPFDRKIGWVRPLAYLVDVDSRLAI